MKPTHRKKPVECTLIQYNQCDDSPAEVREINGRLEVYNKLHDYWIVLESDDYINISTPGDYYPIKRHIVESTYERIEE
jgi:hypothetical protein